MAQWLRTLFPARRRPPAPAPPEPTAPPEPPPPASLSARLAFWRTVLAAEARRAPSVDEAQRRDAQEQRHRLAEGTDRIARGIARRGAWFPWDD